MDILQKNYQAIAYEYKFATLSVVRETSRIFHFKVEAMKYAIIYN